MNTAERRALYALTTPQRFALMFGVPLFDSPKPNTPMSTIILQDLNKLAALVHEANRKWWQDIDTGAPIERNRREMLALVVSEVSECLEGERKDLMDDKLPHRKMAEVEMADTFIRLLDFAAGFGHTILERSASNVPDNKGEALFRLTVKICMIETYPETGISESLGFIRNYCTKHGYDLHGAIVEKLAYNATRQDHTHEARRIAGGKQF